MSRIIKSTRKKHNRFRNNRFEGSTWLSNPSWFALFICLDTGYAPKWVNKIPMVVFIVFGAAKFYEKAPPIINSTAIGGSRDLMIGVQVYDVNERCRLI